MPGISVQIDSLARRLGGREILRVSGDTQQRQAGSQGAKDRANSSKDRRHDIALLLPHHRDGSTFGQ